MANKKISELPRAAAVLPTDEFLLARSGKNYKVAAEVLGSTGGQASGGAPIVERFAIDWQDPAFTTPGYTVRIPLFDLPAMGKVLGVTTRHTEAFGGLGLSTVAVSVGSNEAGWYEDDFYSSGFELTSQPGPRNFKDAVQYQSISLDDHGLMAVFNADQSFGDGSNTYLQQGQVDLWVAYLKLS